MALGAAVLERVWLRKVFAFSAGMANNLQINLCMGNQRAIKMTKNDAGGNQTRHIDTE